ncbi:MAG: amino acid carrier protein [Ruminococcus sp.]|nr:amino acid carrier protein [Candidatus Apopatosoma intestinale]
MLLSSVSRTALSVLPIVILTAGFFLLIRLRAFFLLHPKKTWGSLGGGAGNGNSPFRVLMVSLAGTLGVGNIVGVAVALMLGGPGAIFWMWVSAFLSMGIKYAEIVLAMRYRHREPDGSYRGGPMYYMKEGVGGAPGEFLSGLFCGVGLVSSFSLGNVIQVNAASEAVTRVLPISKTVFGILCALVCAVLVMGGFRKIANVTAVLIPAACAVYFLLCFFVLIRRASDIPAVFVRIFHDAVTPDAGRGGVLGFLTSAAVRHGTAKGTFSHEAGSGTSPMSHAQSAEPCAAKQGLYGILEVFFDTIVICTLTALVLLLSGIAPESANGGMDYVLSAFGRFFGRAADWIFAGFMTVFALSTVVCYSYYGTCFLRFFTKNKTAEAVYLILYSLITWPGAVASPGILWTLTDLGVVAMTTVNLIAVLFLSREVREETKALL